MGDSAARRDRCDALDLARPGDHDQPRGRAHDPEARRPVRDRPPRRGGCDHRTRGGLGGPGAREESGRAAVEMAARSVRPPPGGAGDQDGRARTAGRDEPRLAAFLRGGLRARPLHDRQPLPVGHRRAPHRSRTHARRALGAAARRQRALRRRRPPARVRARPPGGAGDRQRPAVLGPVVGRAAAAGGAREPRRGDHRGRRRGPDGVRQRGRAATAGARVGGGAIAGEAGRDHVPVHRPERVRRGARARVDAGAASVPRRSGSPAARAQHRARDRRGALDRGSRLADRRPRERPRDVRRQRVRGRHPGEAGAARRGLHGAGQPRARVLDGLRGDASAGRQAGRRRSRRLVRRGRRRRTGAARTRRHPSRGPGQARARRAAGPLPAHARRPRRHRLRGPVRQGADLQRPQQRDARGLRPRRRAPAAAARDGHPRCDHRPAGGAHAHAGRADARVLTRGPAADRGRPRSRRAPRAPRGHGGGKRTPLHRAHPNRAGAPAGAVAGLAAADAGLRGGRPLPARGGAERGRRRLLRRVPLRQRAAGCW